MATTEVVFGYPTAVIWLQLSWCLATLQMLYGYYRATYVTTVELIYSYSTVDYMATVELVHGCRRAGYVATGILAYSYCRARILLLLN